MLLTPTFVGLLLAGAAFWAVLGRGRLADSR
jgi:hypothetical protein